MKVYAEYLDHHNPPIVREYETREELIAEIAGNEDVDPEEVQESLEICQSFEGSDTWNLLTPSVVDERIRDLKALYLKVCGL